MTLKIKFILIKTVVATSIALILLSCGYKNTTKDTEKFASKLKKDVFELKGTYYWNFKLMGALQESINKFYADSIAYEMKGKIYSTKYTMQKLSYDHKEKRWIGEATDKTVYVLFFKEVTDSAMVIYKHKCKDKGIQEALEFPYPKPNATEDHGWNVYRNQKKVLAEDNMPFTGQYISEKEKLSITNDTINFNGKKYQKMSYHPGERRWTGKHKDTKEYLQLFFKPFSSYHSVYIDIQKYDDLEKAYKTKYNKDNQFIKFIKNEQ